MRIVDTQIHISQSNSQEFPWSPEALAGMSDRDRQRFETPDCGMDSVISMMDAAGVSGAILASRGAVYRADPKYALAAAKKYPGRFAVAGAIYPDIEDIEAHLGRLRENKDIVAIRVVVPTNSPERLTSMRYRALLESAENLSFPIFIHVTHTPGMVADVETVAHDYPNLTIVLDHLGLHAPPSENSEDLAVVLRLANHENVAVKCAGLPELSNDAYPYRDTWPALRRIIDAYGADRVMWASDITAQLLRMNYQQAVGLICDEDRLSQREKEMILYGTVQKLLHWPRVA